MRRWPIAGAFLLSGVARAAAPTAATDLAQALDAGLAPLAAEARTTAPILVDEIVDKLAWLSLHDTHPAVVREAIARALAQHGFHSVDAAASAGTPVQALAARRDLAGVLQFQLDSAWGTPHLQVALTMRSGNATQFELSPPNAGLLSLSTWKIGGLALIAALPVALLMTRRARPRKVAPLVQRPGFAAPPPKKRKHDDGIGLSTGAIELMREEEALMGPVAATLPSLGAPGSPVPPPPRTPPPGSIGLMGSVMTPARLRDRYRIVGELGRGAMGVVYRAVDENLEREVAVKVINDDMRTHPEAMRLFASEAKLLAQLNHPGIVAIYDQVGNSDEAMLVMELVDGTTLDRDLTVRGRYPWRDALGLIDQLCDGLAYAHGKNVVHRDIKPANIFITGTGRVKLGDFGLARLAHEAAGRSTQIRGTPMYMAPEQITGGAIDGRTDLYAVGCTLFELVSGRPVFLEGDQMFQQLHGEPQKLREVAPDAPEAVEVLVSEMLAKKLADRPASADAVRTTIAQILTTT